MISFLGCVIESDILNHLADIYPDMTVQVFSSEFEETHGDPADREGCCPFPVLLTTTRYTQGRIMDMVAYLLGQAEAPQEYAKQLCKLVPFRLVFNYFTDEYVADFCAVPLIDGMYTYTSEIGNRIYISEDDYLVLHCVNNCEYSIRYLRQMHAPLRGIFGPNSLNVARYAAFIWAKSPTKWDAQLAEVSGETGRTDGITF